MLRRTSIMLRRTSIMLRRTGIMLRRTGIMLRRTGIMLRRTGIVLYVGDGVLDLVLRGDVLPCCQEHLLVHLPVVREQHVQRYLGGQVEHVDVVLYCYLKSVLFVCLVYKALCS